MAKAAKQRKFWLWCVIVLGTEMDGWRVFLERRQILELPPEEIPETENGILMLERRLTREHDTVGQYVRLRDWKELKG